MTFGTIVWVVVGGALLGVVAKLFVQGRQSVGFLWTVGAGIVGMLVGNWLAGVLGVRHTAGIDWIRHGLQVAVAILAIVLVVPVRGALGRGRS